MTDKELLEMAAKAAGIAVRWNENPPCTVMVDEIGDAGWWGPLDDDSDALRLALSIPACVVIDNDMQWCGVHLNGNRGKYDILVPFGDDKAAATRRAIVRAAAEIGRAMP